MSRRRRISRQTCCCLAVALAWLGSLWLLAPSPSSAAEPATAGIAWNFEPDSPSAEALIAFRKPPRQIEEVEEGFLWIDAVVASKLRLTVRTTNGARSARVFEIRVYDE
jgi:hypothetical protein